MSGKKIRQTIQTAFMTPDSSRSRKRSAMIENITMRYATKANEITMNHTTSQNDIAASFLWSTTAIEVCSWGPCDTSSRADDPSHPPGCHSGWMMRCDRYGCRMLGERGGRSRRSGAVRYE